MADVASLKVVILWAEEVRIAARAMHALRDALKSGEVGDGASAKRDAALRAALEACFVCLGEEALTGDCAIMCAESPLRGAIKKPRPVVEVIDDEEGGAS